MPSPFLFPFTKLPGLNKRTEVLALAAVEHLADAVLQVLGPRAYLR